jgi:hypothetical protein
VQAGTVWTNTGMDGFPEVTFGGVKQSGQGREIGRYGLEEFMEIKSVVMRLGRTPPDWVTARREAGCDKRKREDNDAFRKDDDDDGGGARHDDEPCACGPR